MEMDLQTVFEYIKTHNDDFIEDLRKIIRIPTVSAHSANNKDLLTCANVIKTILENAQIDNIRIFDNYEKPLIYGEKIINPNYKTILLYAHYDVQPVEPLELWLSEPFDLDFRGEKMYGRGVSDDKGSIIMLIKAVEALIKTQNLHCNIKFIFEGGEEIASADFIKFLNDKKNTTLLKNDLTLICDSSFYDKQRPLIYIGARGICCFDLKVYGPNKDVHSGVFGGLIGNPINALCSIISSFHDENHSINIENFYSGVKEISQKEHEICLGTNFDDEEVKNDLAIEDFFKEKNLLSNEVTGLRPSIEVNGIYGGYTGEGTKTIIPSYAIAKISCRLVVGQDPVFVIDCIKKHIEKNLPKGFTFEINITEEGGKAFRINEKSSDFELFCQMFEKEFGKYPLPSFEGASVPVVSHIKELLNDNILFCGFSERDSLMHSLNENFYVENFFKGIKTLVRFIAYYR